MFVHNIFLIGFMGTGKSTIARILSQMHGFKVAEMDEEIAMKEEKSIPQIFEEYGEAYFRNLETEYLRKLHSSKEMVVSCGGGVVLRKENVQLMKENGTIILLDASPEEIYERVKNDNERPLLKGRKSVEAIKELMEARRTKYEAAADIIISTDGKTAEEICVELINELKRAKERE